MRAVLIANGEIEDINLLKSSFLKDDFVICIDGGLKYAREGGILPNCIVGDFDSASQETLNFYRQKDVEIVKFPAKKDYTDLELGMEIAFSKKVDELVILGGLGGRYDHTVSNIFNLKKAADRRIKASILSSREEIHLIYDSIEINEEIGTTVSLIPISEQVLGVVTKGMMYSLKNENLFMGESRGVSNIIIEKKAGVDIKEGHLAVVINKKNKTI